MELSLFSKFSWFLVLTTLSHRLSGYFTFPMVWLICIWLLIRCQSSLCEACLLSAPVLVCPCSAWYHLWTAQPTLLCQLLSYGMGFLLGSTGMRNQGLFPNHSALVGVSREAVPPLGSNFRLIVPASDEWSLPLDFRSMISSSSCLGMVVVPMIYFWIAPPFPDGLLALLSPV